jgi:NhaP-type Na+/H+ or K+/H+ antiporter
MKLGVIVYITNLSDYFSSIFLVLLLPPIIFESGYNLNKHTFFKNIGAVLVYSFLGTFIAIFSSSIMFWFFGQLKMSAEFTWKESFAFGSLISATDPVSVLAIFKEMNADVNLFAIIFGESIFNDAVAIVMYQTVMLSGSTAEATVWESIYKGAGDFTLIFVGSLIIGAVMALLVAFVLKRQSSYVKDTVESSDASFTNHSIKKQTK